MKAGLKIACGWRPSRCGRNRGRSNGGGHNRPGKETDMAWFEFILSLVLTIIALLRALGFLTVN
jgi:hypothetical protein